MTNILPLDAQKRVWGMYRSRFVLAAGLVLLILSALAAFALLPSYLALEIAAPPENDSIVHTSTSTPQDIVAITRAQTIMSSIVPFVTSTSSPADDIAAALKARPAGVTITHIVYNAQTTLITLEGTASRDAISAFHDALAKDPLFTNVSLPVDSLVGEGGDFTISITGNF